MKTRIIQREPERADERARRGRRPPPPRARSNLAARMGRWSAAHRKKAIFGWLAFVVVAFVVGRRGRPENISDRRQPSPASRGDAERGARSTPGCGRTTRSCSSRATTLTVDDPAFRAAVDDVDRPARRASRRSRTSQSPLDGNDGADLRRRPRRAGRFEIAGDSTEATDRVDPTIAAVAAAGRPSIPTSTIEQFGGASADKAPRRRRSAATSRKAGLLSLPVTLIILVVAFGSLVAAGVPLLLGAHRGVRRIGLVALPSQLVPLDRNRHRGRSC